MLSFTSFWLLLLTLAYSNSCLLLLFTLSFLFSPALNSSHHSVPPSFLSPASGSGGFEWPRCGNISWCMWNGAVHSESYIPRSQYSFQISPLLANSYLHVLGSLRSMPSKDGVPCGTILWKPFWKRVLCSWRGHVAVMCTRVMRKQKYEPNCLTQHLVLLLV